MRTLYIQSPKPLCAFAESCFTLTPKVSLCPSAGLYLEIESTQKAWGGEARLLLKADQLAESFLGDDRRMVLVDRPEWARALWKPELDFFIPPGKSAARLQALPLSQLVWVGDPFKQEQEQPEKEKLVAFMRKVGLRTIGDFLALPLAAVLRRFGKEGETLHDWAGGRRPLCLPPFSPSEVLSERIDADDLHSLEALVFALRAVLLRMEVRLQGRCAATRKLLLTFNLESHDPVVKTLEFTEPLQDARKMLRVAREFLASFHWESPLVRLELQAQDCVPHLPGQLSLLDDFENKFHDLAHYVGRLRARLGEERVGFAALKSSHLPERSYALAWPPQPAPERRDGFPKRPLFLFTPPKPFQPSPRWDLTLSENLLVEWWEPGGRREYFVARSTHECLWVYRDSVKGEWFAHGTFD